MTVLITLTTAGSSSGPFNLYSNLDGYVSAFATGVSQASLLAGYSSSAVPDYTTTIRVKSTGACTNYIDIVLNAPTTTTTTTVAPTTTTTTTFVCSSYILLAPGVSGEHNTVDYINCAGVASSISAYDYANVGFCARSIITGSPIYNGVC